MSLTSQLKREARKGNRKAKRQLKLRDAVDRLGEIKAQIADLEEDEKLLKARLASSGQEVVEGELFRATISEHEVEEVDRKGLIEKLRPSQRLLRKFTTTKTRTQVRVVSRNGNGV